MSLYFVSYTFFLFLNKNAPNFQKHTKINKLEKYKFDSNKQEKNEIKWKHKNLEDPKKIKKTYKKLKKILL